MNIDGAFPSTYLKHADLNNRAIRLTMANVVIEEVGDDSKPVLYFQGAKKGLVLNKINAATISTAYGHETDAWTGKVIEIYPDMTHFQGRPTPCIRVRAPLAPAPAHAPAPAPAPAASILDDEIPF